MSIAAVSIAGIVLFIWPFLGLGLPPEVPARESIITISFAVVAFSVFVQGLTMTPLLRRLGEIPGRPSMPTQ